MSYMHRMQLLITSYTKKRGCFYQLDYKIYSWWNYVDSDVYVLNLLNFDDSGFFT